MGFRTDGIGVGQNTGQPGVGGGLDKTVDVSFKNKYKEILKAIPENLNNDQKIEFTAEQANLKQPSANGKQVLGEVDEFAKTTLLGKENPSSTFIKKDKEQIKGDVATVFTKFQSAQTNGRSSREFKIENGSTATINKLGSLLKTEKKAYFGTIQDGQVTFTKGKVESDHHVVISKLGIVVSKTAYDNHPDLHNYEFRAHPELSQKHADLLDRMLQKNDTIIVVSDEEFKKLITIHNNKIMNLNNHTGNTEKKEDSKEVEVYDFNAVRKPLAPAGKAHHRENTIFEKIFPTVNQIYSQQQTARERDKEIRHKEEAVAANEEIKTKARKEQTAGIEKNLERAKAEEIKNE